MGTQVIRQFLSVPEGLAHTSLNPAGGWLVSAMFTACKADPATQELLQTMLGSLGERLRKANPAVWHKCGLDGSEAPEAELAETVVEKVQQTVRAHGEKRVRKRVYCTRYDWEQLGRFLLSLSLQCMMTH